MPQSAEPQALPLKLGKVVLISVPNEFAPTNLEWHKWVANTAIRFERFETVSTHKFMLLDQLQQTYEAFGALHGDLVRQQLLTADPINILKDRSGGYALMAYGSWTQNASAWIESLRQITHATHLISEPKYLERQFEIWRDLALGVSDDTMFVLSESGHRFTNASQICNAWTHRIKRSRLLNESIKGGWCAGVMQIHDNIDQAGNSLRLQRLETLSSTLWCGDPDWENSLSDIVQHHLSLASEVWLSLPFMCLCIDALERLRRIGLSATVEVKSPSCIVGWHPIRDFMLFLHSKAKNRVLVFLDSFERLQILHIDSI